MTDLEKLAKGLSEVEKCCGTCRLWALNYYSNLMPSLRGTGCCADVKLDLPASWSTNTPMLSSDGSDCCAWEHLKGGEG